MQGPFWRAITVFRIASVGYAAVLLGTADSYARPAVGWLVIAVMALWTAAAGFAYARFTGWLLLVVDLAVTVGCLLASPFVQGTAGGSVPITATWVAGPVLAWAVRGGRRAGIAAAIVVSAADAALRDSPAAIAGNGTVLLLLAAVAVGHVSRLAKEAEEQLRNATRAEAATRERERLARGIHDSVLQVLALVQRRGQELGGDAAELGRLAGEQEAALRELIRSEPVRSEPASGHGDGLTDLATRLRRYGTARVTVTTDGTPMPLPDWYADEVAAAVGAALENVRRHCGDGTMAWVFAESDGDAITVTIRDDGQGIPDGRLQRAAAEGRMGVARSIRGRIADLGGTVDIVSTTGRGTEVELTVPARRSSWLAGPPHGPGRTA